MTTVKKSFFGAQRKGGTWYDVQHTGRDAGLQCQLPNAQAIQGGLLRDLQQVCSVVTAL